MALGTVIVAVGMLWQAWTRFVPYIRMISQEVDIGIKSLRNIQMAMVSELSFMSLLLNIQTLHIRH